MRLVGVLKAKKMIGPHSYSGGSAWLLTQMLEQLSYPAIPPLKGPCGSRLNSQCRYLVLVMSLWGLWFVIGQEQGIY